jgi:hypothetical protein
LARSGEDRSEPSRASHRRGIVRGGPAADQTIPESEKWARRAIEIEPHCSTAWAVLCYLEGMLCELEPIRSPRRVAMALENGLKAAISWAKPKSESDICGRLFGVVGRP